MQRSYPVDDKAWVLILVRREALVDGVEVEGLDRSSVA